MTELIDDLFNDYTEINETLSRKTRILSDLMNELLQENLELKKKHFILQYAGKEALKLIDEHGDRILKAHAKKLLEIRKIFNGVNLNDSIELHSRKDF